MVGIANKSKSGNKQAPTHQMHKQQSLFTSCSRCTHFSKRISFSSTEVHTRKRQMGGGGGGVAAEGEREKEREIGEGRSNENTKHHYENTFYLFFL